MATKKKVVKKDPKRSTLYLYISTENKKWLNALCAKQVGKISKSTMAEKLFHVLRTNPEILKGLVL